MADDGEDRTKRPAPAELTAGLYGDLETRARSLLRRRRMSWHPETCSLVNRACVNLLEGKRARFETRGDFLAFAATALRNVLVDLARERLTEKRGGGKAAVPISPDDAEVGADTLDAATVLDVQSGLEKLTRDAPDVARVVELHYFGGLSWAEVAEVTGKSEEDVQKDWYFGRAWFRSELRDGEQ